MSSGTGRVAFVCSDPEVVAAYEAAAEEESRIVKKCFREVVKETGHEPMIYDHRDYVSMDGIKLHPKKGGKVEHTAWGSIKIPDPPPGWRKRVKDDYFSPPLKGGGPEAQAARDLVKKFSRIENMRGYMTRVHGAPSFHFHGLSLISIGLNVVDGKLYVISAGEYTVKDERFKKIKYSAYLAAIGE